MDTIVNLHSFWRWIVLIVALATILIGVLGWLNQQNWSSPAATLSRMFPVAIDIQVLLGIALWVGEGQYSFNNFYLAILHPLMGIGTLAVAHVVSARIKRGSGDVPRYRLMALGYLLVLLGIVVTVPDYAWRF